MIRSIESNPAMPHPDDLILVTRESATRSAVSTALAMANHDAEPDVCGDLAEMTAILDQRQAGVAIVDVDGEGSSMLSTLEPIISRFPRTRFIAIAREASQHRMLEAMNAGVRHLLVKSSIVAELPGVLGRLSIRNGHRHGNAMGSAVTVLSAGGGCGATTLAVNLASELPRGATEAALVVDMDDAYGAVASYLGLRGDYGIAEVLDNAGEIDAELVRSTALKFDDRLHALLSPASVQFNQPTPIDASMLSSALLACRQAYRWTVVDAPRVSVDVAAMLGRLSGHTLIVAQLCVKDVRCSRQIRGALIDRGVNADSIRCVINRHRSKRQTLTVDDARTVLGDCPIELLRNDYAAAADGINYGRLLADAAPRSALRRDIADLAASLGAARPTASTSQVSS